MIKLENKLYSSTEVADILGVSLRSVYRYLEEGKLNAEVKTATGRHRFTRQNIIDFLYPKGIPQEGISVDSGDESEEAVENVTIKAEKKKDTVELEEEEDVVVSEQEPEESVDWLSKFREAAKKFEDSVEDTEVETPATESHSPVTGLADDTEVEEEPEEQMFYYRSRLGGLKDIAQSIDKTSSNSGLDYAFTMNAGLSLYKPINPFSMLHVYIRSKDRDFFERILTLTPSDENGAQLCLIISDDDKVYKNADELHGLKVVEKKRLLEDVSELDQELLKEAGEILS